MKLISSVCNALILTAVLPLLAGAQGTMIVDQQSSDESNGGSSFVLIQSGQPTGQSFTPALSAIGFVRFNVFDHIRNDGTGATLYVNLRTDSITGPIIDSTAPAALLDNFGPRGFVNFYFPTNVPIQLGTKYYLEPVVQSGEDWGIVSDLFNYSGGEQYVRGTAVTGIDYWFREGIIVPEPAIPTLLFCAAGLWLQFRRLNKPR
jgi:hypothetical protein